MDNYTDTETDRVDGLHFLRNVVTCVRRQTCDQFCRQMPSDSLTDMDREIDATRYVMNKGGTE